MTIDLPRAATQIALYLVLFLPLGGCAAGSLVSAVAGMGVQTVVAGGVVGATAIEGEDKVTEDPEDQAARCDQLASAPPLVLALQGAELTPWTLAQSGTNGQWMPAASASAIGINALTFNPPLSDAVNPDKRMFLVYAPVQAATIADNNLMTSLVGSFEPAAGTFSLNERSYRYALVKKLPCFPSAR